jgi:hypothetical protein
VRLSSRVEPLEEGHEPRAGVNELIAAVMS